MRKFAILFAMLFVWGCQQDNGPFEFTSPDTDGVHYGSSVVKLPGLALAKVAASSVQYKFSLTITGDGMQPMTFGWPVDGSGQSFTIDKIPAGKARMFKGVLYGSNGATYEGTAYADIYGGQVAYISLVLRKLGSAQVEVIIEDFEQQNIIGCYKIDGRVDTTSLSGLTMSIMDISSDSSLFVYFYQNGKMVGKFYGTLNNMKMSGDFVIPDAGFGTVEGYLDAYISSDFQAFKGEVFSRKNHSYPIGSMYGQKTACDTDTTIVPPSECFYDTLGGPNSTSCKDTSTWIKYAYEECNKMKAVLNGYYFQGSCDSTDQRYFNTIIFKYCTTK
jgi:hypothetical protein